MMQTVGIIGNGFVGSALHENFKRRVSTKVYDISPEKCLNSYDDVLNSDFIFVCLPTPMLENGDCDVSIVWEFFESIPKNVSGLFAIKSTVPIGTTNQLCEFRSDLRIVHNPEFLTAANAQTDFFNCDRNVIGGSNLDDCKDLMNFLYKVFHEWEDVPCYLVDCKESETIKYFSNSFLAVKIAYFNHLYQICEFFGLDFEMVRHAVAEDKRIGASHTKVPGPDGQLGFGGYCFPKDINALLYTMKDLNLDTSLLEAAWVYNTRIRDEFKQ